MQNKNDTQENMSSFSHMNEMQKKAICHTEGPLLILAGAGSGKTTVLVNRIAYILQCGLCQPWQILAITFTNKAASELKERIGAAVGSQSGDIWASTFHSTCARILRRYGDKLGYTSHFTVYDTDDQKRLLKNIFRQLGIDEKYLPIKAVLGEISRAKDKMETPEDMQKNAGYDARKVSIARCYAQYQKSLKQSDAMDFDDMLLNTVALFELFPEVLEKYRSQFKYIMVDEYQDTNKVQYRFISLLAQAHNNLCVVGDDDQSIYKFRGATIENIMSFEEQFKNAAVIRLEQNYRSTQNILDAANGVISHNTSRKGKTLWTENDRGESIVFHTVESERGEAKFIADTILEGVAVGRSFSDFAILYRMNAQSNSIEQTLSRSGIPHRIIGGHRFYDREEIKDMTAYLQVINNTNDDVRLRRIINKPKRKIGDATLEKAAEIALGLGVSIFDVIKEAEEYPALSRACRQLKEFVGLIESLIEIENDEEKSLNDLYLSIIELTEYKKYLEAEKENWEIRIENIEELSTNIIKFEEEYGEEATLTNFLEEIALQTDIDNYDADADCAVMMTLHSAKGLEFPVVFIPGMEDGIFPSTATMFNPDEMDEERRLAYVGITRAKERLYLIKSECRMLFGQSQRNRVSRFVTEIPEELMEKSGESRWQSMTKSTALPQISQIGGINSAQKLPSLSKSTTDECSFSKGDSVKHKVFGSGMVIKAEKMGSDTMLEVSFDKVGTKILMAKFSKLTKN